MKWVWLNEWGRLKRLTFLSFGAYVDENAMFTLHLTVSSLGFCLQIGGWKDRGELSPISRWRLRRLERWLERLEGIDDLNLNYYRNNPLLRYDYLKRMKQLIREVVKENDSTPKD